LLIVGILDRMVEKAHDGHRLQAIRGILVEVRAR
jgi:hypothetical protein